MKIKLALLDNDANYLNRLVVAFNTKYSDKFEIYSFTDAEYAMQNVSLSKMDVFVAGTDLNINVARLPERCCFAYFTPDSSVEEINGFAAIGKFQKIDLIYRQILGLYAEKAGNWSSHKVDDGSSKMIVFSSPCGGAGTSTIAAACAKHFALLGKKVLYLNFEKYGCSDSFFSAAGQFDLSDVIFALKSKKANLSLKLESCVKQDVSGVYYYSHPKLVLDMLELSFEDMSRVITEVKLSGQYEYIILDMDFSLNKTALDLYDAFNYIVWCSDGSDTNNSKIVRAYNAFSIIEQNDDYQIADRIRLIYNKHNNVSKSVAEDKIKSIGAIPFSEHSTYADLLNKCAHLDLYDKLLK